MSWEIFDPLTLDAEIRLPKDDFVVCVSGDYIAVPGAHVVYLYDVFTLTLHHTFGGEGSAKGQFKFATVCFGICAGAGSVFVSDVGNQRVCEHAVPTGTCRRVLGLTHLKTPRGVDANSAHIVVADFHGGSVLLFGADAEDAAPPKWVFRGSGSELLQTPTAARLSRDGTIVHVADFDGDQYVDVDAHTGVATGTQTPAPKPLDWIECGDSGDVILLVWGNHLVKVDRNGNRVWIPRSDTKHFDRLSGIAYAPQRGLIVRNFMRLSVFNVVS